METGYICGHWGKGQELESDHLCPACLGYEEDELAELD